MSGIPDAAIRQRRRAEQEMHDGKTKVPVFGTGRSLAGGHPGRAEQRRRHYDSTQGRERAHDTFPETEPHEL